MHGPRHHSSSVVDQCPPLAVGRFPSCMCRGIGHNSISGHVAGMNLSALLAIGSIIGLLYGVAFLLAPELVLAAYGIQTTPAAILGYRYFGVALLTIAVLARLIKYSTDWIALRSDLYYLRLGSGRQSLGCSKLSVNVT